MFVQMRKLWSRESILAGENGPIKRKKDFLSKKKCNVELSKLSKPRCKIKRAEWITEKCVAYTYDTLCVLIPIS